jgi:uncharacterized protein (UPF0335 family)
MFNKIKVKYMKRIKLFESFSNKEIEVGYKFKTTATLYKDKYFHHFGIRPITANLYGNNVDDIIEVQCEVIEIGYPDYKPDNSVQYWGFYDIKRKNVSLIYPSWLQFYTCFPYGPKAEEERGVGYCVKIDVREFVKESKSNKDHKDIKDVILGLRGIDKDKKEESLELLKTYTKAGSSKITGLNLHTKLKEKIKRYNLPDGFDMGLDKKGYFIHTHRARSKSYQDPSKINIKDIKFIDSTG